MKKIVEKFKNHLAKKGAPEFEIFFMREQCLEAEVKDQKLNAFESAETLGASLRVIHQNRLGFSYTTELTDQGITKAVDEAMVNSHHSDAREYLQLPHPDPSINNSFLDDYDKSLGGISPQKKIALALELEKAALHFDPRVKKVRGASYEGSVSEIMLANSWGLEAHHQKSMNVLSLMAVAEEGSEAEAAYEFGFSCFFADLDSQSVGKRAAQKAIRYLGGKPGPTLKGPVLLDSWMAAETLEVLAGSFYADHLVKKRSLFEGAQGRPILSSALTIIDDGCLKGGFASFPFDGEGVPKKRMVVVDRGVFNQPLADTEYGLRLQGGSTGSSVREGLRYPPQIGYSNFFIERGSTPLEKLFQKMGHGVYITELIGMHTANPISGDFSVGAQGFLVEKGEITGPIKQIALSGNLKEMMNRIEEVASDLRFYFKVGSPSLLVSEMDVAGI
jgi:PmbA protein